MRVRLYNGNQAIDTSCYISGSGWTNVQRASTLVATHKHITGSSTVLRDKILDCVQNMFQWLLLYSKKEYHNSLKSISFISSTQAPMNCVQT